MHAAVKQFHQAFGIPVSEQPSKQTLLDTDVGVADPLIDTAYVALGAIAADGAVPSQTSRYGHERVSRRRDQVGGHRCSGTCEYPPRAMSSPCRSRRSTGCR